MKRKQLFSSDCTTHRVMAGQLSTQIDFRPSEDPVSIINEPWQPSHSKVEQIGPQKILLNRNLIPTFGQILTEIDYIRPE